MKNRLTLATLGTLLLASCGCGNALFDNSSGEIQLVSVGASVSKPDWSFSCNHVFMKKNEPTVVFGMYETPKGEHRLSYFWILGQGTVKDIHAGGTTGQQGSLNFDGETASMTGGIEVDGKHVDFDIKYQVNDETGTLQTTKFTMNGKDIDTSMGLVLLIDLASDTDNYEQVNAKLPSDLPAPETLENVETIARQILKQLKNENDRVREFLAE
ncbi:MAG: hypothetical protein OSA89_16035 [Mariniblastus sp.]|nr:hypothetical protein [Mariniblastus sp.]